jgi:hypothetical protein
MASCRSRANLRPRSRSASVIDRLLKNQSPLENRNNLRSSSPHPGPGQTSGEPRRNFAVRNSSTREPWLFRSPVFGSGIRRLDGEAVGGRRLAGWRLRQSHHRLQHSLQPGMNARPQVPRSEAQADFIRDPRGPPPPGRDNRGDGMKDWLVPPIVIPCSCRDSRGIRSHSSAVLANGITSIPNAPPPPLVAVRPFATLLVSAT